MTKNVARFALPLLCANLVQLMYSAADALFAGNVEGTAGIAAIGASSLAVTCMVSFLSGFSVGSNVLVASKRGARDEEGFAWFSVLRFFLRCSWAHCFALRELPALMRWWG